MSRKTIVIVGAGKGMGNHIARKFAENGFRVVLIARSQKNLEEYAEEFKASGVEIFTQAADASDTNSLKEAFRVIKEKFGAVDVMVYNAAILEGGLPSALSEEELLLHYKVDVAGALFCARQVIPEQAARGAGTILFTGGGFALHPSAEYTCVSMDKAALRALSFALHQELKDKGIFVGTVTIMGNVAEGTHYAPELIAEKYWQLYTERKECEVVYE